jgi:hypothetical protein
MDHRGGLVEAPVVYHDHFERARPRVHVLDNGAEMGKEAGGFVMGWDDDG